jgi:hypothetical protein
MDVMEGSPVGDRWFLTVDASCCDLEATNSRGAMIPTAESVRQRLLQVLEQIQAGTYVPYEQRRARALGQEQQSRTPTDVPAGEKLWDVRLNRKS